MGNQCWAHGFPLASVLFPIVRRLRHVMLLVAHNHTSAPCRTPVKGVLDIVRAPLRVSFFNKFLVIKKGNIIQHSSVGTLNSSFSLRMRPLPLFSTSNRLIRYFWGTDKLDSRGVRNGCSDGVGAGDEGSD